MQETLLNKQEAFSFAYKISELCMSNKSFNYDKVYEDYVTNILPKEREIVEIGKMITATSVTDKERIASLVSRLLDFTDINYALETDISNYASKNVLKIVYKTTGYGE